MSELAPGFLIAVPQLQDPNFRLSVVLLFEQSDEGALGVVVNQDSPLLLKDLCEDHDIPYSGDPEKKVRKGGPVQPGQDQKDIDVRLGRGIPARLGPVEPEADEALPVERLELSGELTKDQTEVRVPHARIMARHLGRGQLPVPAGKTARVSVLQRKRVGVNMTSSRHGATRTGQASSRIRGHSLDLERVDSALLRVENRDLADPVRGIADVDIPACGLVPYDLALCELEEQDVVFFVVHDLHREPRSVQWIMMVLTMIACPVTTAAQTRLSQCVREARSRQPGSLRCATICGHK